MKLSELLTRTYIHFHTFQPSWSNQSTTQSLTSIFASSVHSSHSRTLFAACTFLHSKENETCQRKFIIWLQNICIKTVIQTEFCRSLNSFIIVKWQLCCIIRNNTPETKDYNLVIDTYYLYLDNLKSREVVTPQAHTNNLSSFITHNDYYILYHAIEPDLIYVAYFQIYLFVVRVRFEKWGNP